MTSNGVPEQAEAQQAGELSPEQLNRLGPVPFGAAALSGTAVLLLLIAWMLIYLAIYLPRGMVG